jgi:hypothetical protein
LEKSAGADHLTATAASGTTDATRPGLGSGAAAFVASVEFSNFDLLFGAKRRFFQSDLHVVTQIRAALSIFGLAGHATEKRFENPAADSAAATENLTENIERIMEPTAKTTARFERGVSKPIVSGAFVRVHQHVVSFAELFKFLFGVRVVRILIRMNFHVSPRTS